jgi:hypothetical protein
VADHQNKVLSVSILSVGILGLIRSRERKNTIPENDDASESETE